MKELHLKAIQAYIHMLTIHIDSKTMDADFHKETESFYEALFDVAHEIGEKHVDLGGHIEDNSIDQKKKEAHMIISDLRNEVEQYAKNNDITLGTEDLLGSLANTLENIEGSSKAFLQK